MANVHGRRLRRYLVIAIILLLFLYLSKIIFSTLGSQPPPRRTRQYIPATFIPPSLSAYPLQRAPPIPAHDFRADGLLTVNPDAPHPIFQLTAQAKKNWNQKLNRASKTLPEAVAEYIRRYKRHPPKGFDQWWKYVQRYNIQLPDEYDFIYKDLEPFFGVSPQDLRSLQAKQEEETDTYTLARNESGFIHVAKRSFSNPETWRERNLLRGSEELVDMLREVEHHIPPFRAVFSPHDNPNLLSDYSIKQMALDAAAAKKHIDMDKLPAYEDRGYVSACAPTSPARKAPPLTQSNRPSHLKDPKPKTFIHDHTRAMDVCLHPDIFYYHSQFIPHELGPSPRRVIAPQFAYCSTMLHHDIQPPTFISWTDGLNDHIPWSQKVDERLMWRGRNTGMNHDERELWRESQRPRLVDWARQLDGHANVLLLNDSSDSSTPVGKGVQIPLNRLNPAMMDINFAGGALGCDHAYCDFLEREYEWRQTQLIGSEEANRYKYIIDVDGQGWSSRFKRLITSNSLVFKSTIYPEWYLDRIEPWLHYVPVQIDLSDLRDALIFFRGGLDGEGAHDKMAQKIAIAGTKWSRSFWRQQDMVAYMFRLLLEYARIMSLDRDSDSASFILPN